MLTCSYRSLVYILFAWMLAACGGGGGGGVDASDGSIGGGASSLTITPILNPVATPYSIEDGNALTINATITDSLGNPVSNADVSYATTLGSLNRISTLTSSTGITSQTATLSAGSTGTPDTGTLTITAFSGTSVGVLTVQFQSEEDTDDTTITPTPSDTTLELSFFDSDGNEFPSQQTIPFGETITVTAVVTPEQVAGTTLTISSITSENDENVAFGQLDSSSLVLTASSDSSLDQSSGSVTLDPQAQSGSATITATLTEDITDQEDISIISPSILFGFANDDNSINTGSIKIDDDDSLSSITLSDSGTALLAAELFIEDTSGTFTNSGNTYARYTQSAKIDYRSNCASTPDAQDDSINKSTISYSSSDTNTINGITLATYKTTSCTDTDTVQAETTINNTLLTATTAINFNAQVANNLEFIDVKDSTGAEISNIALQGSPSTLPKSARVTFRVLDDSNPVQGVKVFFELTSNKGGVTLSTDDPDTVTYPDGLPLSTDASGEVTVTVNSGDLPTDVAIKATIEDSDDADNDTSNDQIDTGGVVTATSTALTITTGYPHQNGVSLAADNTAPNAFDYQGVPVELTFRASDLNQQAAPDGTSINFKAENGGGQLVNENEVDTSSCQLSNGACSLTWRSQTLNNKPDVSRAMDSFIVSTEDNRNINDMDLLLATVNGSTIYQQIVTRMETLASETYDDDADTNTPEVAKNNSIGFDIAIGDLAVDLVARGISTDDLLSAASSNETSLVAPLTTSQDFSDLDGDDADETTNTDGIAAITYFDIEDGQTEYLNIFNIVGSLNSVDISTLPYSTYNSNSNDKYGLVEILAWTTGEESFTDNNGDGLFNGDAVAEEMDDLDEPFTDNNQSGSRDNEPGINVEEIEDTNGNSTYDTANNLYNGFRCDTAASNAGHCPTTNKLIDVRDSITLISATSNIRAALIDNSTNLTFAGFRDTSGAYRPLNAKRAEYKGMLRPFRTGVTYDSDGNINSINIDDVGNSYSFDAFIYDLNGNPPPVGTTIEITAPTSAKLTSSTDTVTVGTSSTPYTISIGLASDPDADDTSGTLTIVVTTPAFTDGNTSFPALATQIPINVTNNN